MAPYRATHLTEPTCFNGNISLQAAKRARIPGHRQVTSVEARVDAHAGGSMILQ
jgi:hypothetical protein